MKIFCRLFPITLMFFALGLPLAWFAFSQQPSKTESPLDVAVYQDLMSHEVTDFADLESLIRDEREWYAIITPPAADFTLRQPIYPVIPFSWSHFPKEFPDILGDRFDYEYSVPVYKLRVVEDRETRQLHFYGKSGELLFSRDTPQDYDPFEWLKSRYPGLYSGRYALSEVKEVEAVYDQARVELIVTLIPTEYVESYLYAQAKVFEYQRSIMNEEDSGFMMMRMGAESNIVITSLAKMTNGLRLEIGYPEEFGDLLEVYRATDLMERDWQLVSDPLETTGTTSIAWLDADFGSLGVAFYAVGNHDLDCDADGFNDAFEIFVIGTDPNDAGSHGAYLSGEIHYSGQETGEIFVRAVTQSADSWSKTWQTVQSSPSFYEIVVANNASYWLKSFMDLNANQRHDVWEPMGMHRLTPLYATTDVASLDVTLVDQPSIWGSISYSGNATGDIHVIAAPFYSWGSSYKTIIPHIQGEASLTGDPVYVSFPVDYSITGLPPGNYIIRAFIDEDGSGFYTPHEPGGQYASTALSVSNRVIGIDFMIDADRDEDGIPDWWEMQYFGGATNAVASTDTDSDGLTNFDEYLLGTEPLDPDTDGDWFMDGYEVDEGFNPLASTNAPVILAIVNDNDEYTASTNILLSLPGVYAEQILVGERLDLDDGIMMAFTHPIPYGLQHRTNDWRDIYFRLSRGANVSPTYRGSIQFDDTAPVLYGITPENNHVTSNRWVKIEGFMFDEGSPVRVFVNDEWSHGGTADTFWHHRVLLEEGTNVVVIRAEDLAGHSTTQTVHIMRDTSADSTPPALQISLSGQSAGTNGMGYAFYGDAPDIHFSGVVDDPTAQVFVYSISDSEIDGPWEAVVTDTQVWAMAHVRPGTNLIMAIASDAAGNTSTSACHVVRDTNFYLRISYLPPYQVMNVASTTVHGVASPMFSNATITVNGVMCNVGSQGGPTSFSTIEKVPLQRGRSKLIVQADIGGNSYYADTTVVGYTVLSSDDRTKGEYRSCFIRMISPGYCSRNEFYEESESRYQWDSEYKTFDTFKAVDSNSFHSCAAEVEPCAPLDPEQTVCWPAPDPYYASHFQETPPFYNHINMGRHTEEIVTVETSSDYRWTRKQDHADSELRFKYYSPTPDPQYIVIHFPSLYMNDVAVTSAYPNIMLNGRQGFMRDGKVSFIMHVLPDQEYTIRPSDFSWPSRNSSVPYLAGTHFGSGKTLHFSPSITIHPLRPTFLSGTTTNFSPHLGESAALKVGIEPSPPPGGYPGISFECWIVRNLVGGEKQTIQALDVDPTNSSNYVTWRDADFSTLALTWNGIPHPVAGYNRPPSVGDDEFVGVGGNRFNRMLPAVEIGKPVPPPFYYAVARLRADYDQSIISEAEKKIVVPQVVLLQSTPAAEAALLAPILDGTNVVASAFNYLDVLDLISDARLRLYAYYGSNVNLRLVTSPSGLSGDYATVTFDTRHPTSDRWGDADWPLDFGNVVFDDTARVYVVPTRNRFLGAYLVEGMTNIPFTVKEQQFTFSKTATHEMGHLLGLVSTNPALNGFLYSDGQHNRPPITPLDIMNRGADDVLEYRIGRTPSGLPWVFRYVNHEYLKFVLPTY